MFNEVNVAAISFRPKKLDLQGNADKLEAMFRDAAREKVQLAVGPEGVLEGYVVNDIIAGNIPVECINDVAVTMRSKVITHFRNLAQELNMCLAFGCAEKVAGDIYNCAVFIDNQGRLRGKYHKMQLAEGAHPSWWYDRLGRHSRAVDTPFGRAGFLICNDRWNPDLARIPVLDGARYLIIPSYGSRDSDQDHAVLARARENGVPVVEANVGVTLIISKGEIVARSRKIETMVTATIAIPAAPSRSNRDLQESAFLKRRGPAMKANYRQTMRGLKQR